MTAAELALAKLQGVSTKLREETHKYLWWGKLKGNITITGSIQNSNDPLRMTFSGQPIEVNNQLKLQGFGNTMILPRKKEYAQNPKFGDDQMKGFEESTSWTWTQIHYNQIRHAITVQKGEQQTAVEAAFNAASTELPALARYFARVENWMATSAIYEGVSENLSASTDVQGLGIAKRYPVNMYYVYNIGASAEIRIAVGLTDGCYPTTTIMDNTASAVDAATNHIIDTNVLDELAALCRAKNIVPIAMEDGNVFWLLIVNSKQAAYIRRSDDFKYAQRELLAGGNSIQRNPLYTGSIGYWNQFLIFQDDIIIRGWDAANNDFLGLNKGNVSQDDFQANLKYNRRWNSQRTASTNRCAIVLGQSALGLVEHTLLGFREDKDDYDNVKGLCGNTKYGYSRLDDVDLAQLQYMSSTPSSITTAINEGSLVLMSYVPATNV